MFAGNITFKIEVTRVLKFATKRKKTEQVLIVKPSDINFK